MREILFRGKRIDNGEWVEGIPIQTHIGTFIVFEENPHYCGQYGYMEIDGLVKVIPETVGMYTELKDKNGVKIFEGDIVNVNTNKDTLYHIYQGRHLVIRFDEYHRFVASGRLEYPLCNHYEWEVIGNIHDNPEFLGVGE